MKILFAMDRRVNAGSIQAVANYVRAGDELGHTIAVYGRRHLNFKHIVFSTDLEAFDYVVFIIDAGLNWLSGLRMPQILSRVPRWRRVIVDSDAMYNEIIAVDAADRNYASERDRRHWIAHYDLIADKILQPTFHPIEARVLPLPFYGYNPAAVINGDAMPSKRFDIVYVGHNWWRWEAISSTFLPALEAVRDRVNGVCFVGSWWGGPACRRHGRLPSCAWDKPEAESPPQRDSSREQPLQTVHAFPLSAKANLFTSDRISYSRQ